MREAILHLSDDQLDRIGLGDVVEAARAAGLRDLTELVCHGPGGVVLFRVDERLDEASFADLDGVEWLERLAADRDGVTYLCKVEAPCLPADFAPDDLGLAHDVDAVRPGGVDLSVIGPQDDLGESVAAASDAGMDLLLERLGDYRGGPTALEALTERQREVVETAYAMGYFEVPRAASTEEIAAELDLDASTVSEHLQRAEHNLLARLVGPRIDRG